MSHFLWESCSLIVFNLNLKFYIPFGKKLQATICTDYTVSGVGSPTASGVYYKSPSHSAIIFLLSYFQMVFFFLYILAAVLVVEYTIIWIISTSVFIYLLLVLNHSLLFPLPPLFACRMYCM